MQCTPGARDFQGHLIRAAGNVSVVAAFDGRIAVMDATGIFSEHLLKRGSRKVPDIPGFATSNGVDREDLLPLDVDASINSYL